MPRYTVLTEWQIDAPVDRVWDALLDARAWPAWWPGIRSVEQVAAGDPSGVGMTLRQRWRSLLPYTMTLDVEIRSIERHRLLDGRASGDMAGTCRWTFEPAGGHTTVRFLVDVEPTRAWMRIPLPFAREVFAANVGAIMAQGRRGLGRLLDATVTGRTVRARPAEPVAA